MLSSELCVGESMLSWGGPREKLFPASAKFGLFTRRPSGRMCASAHLAPNLQLPYEI